MRVHNFEGRISLFHPEAKFGLTNLGIHSLQILGITASLGPDFRFRSFGVGRFWSMIKLFKLSG